MHAGRGWSRTTARLREASRWDVQGGVEYCGSPSQQQAVVRIFQNALPHSVFAASDEVDEVGFVISGISTMLGTQKALKKSL